MPSADSGPECTNGIRFEDVLAILLQALILQHWTLPPQTAAGTQLVLDLFVKARGRAQVVRDQA